MKRELTAVCIALAALSGCSNDSSPDCASNLDQYSSTSQALIGEVGGLPWGSAASKQYQPSNSSTNAFFGTSVVVGDFDHDGKDDFAVSQGDFMSDVRGYVTIKQAKSSTANTPVTLGSDANGFGASMAVAKCAGVTGDVLIASAPYYSPNDAEQFNGAIGMIYDSGNGKVVLRKTVINRDALEVAGSVIAVGDVDGDGTDDLVYQSLPMTADYDFLPAKVNVLLNVCSYANGKRFAASASVEEPEGDSVNDSLFGSAIYVADLDGKGTNEIIVVDYNFDDVESEVSAKGAIYFYKYDTASKKLVESRPKIVGESNDVSGGSIEAVAFADLDGDGDLDLIVGEPMYQEEKKREGRVRTYINDGAGKAFNDAAPFWSAVGDRTNAHFGASLAVADVNSDGVSDLIVGAPGMVDSTQGYAYVYVGTKDGTIFSKEAYWTYISSVSTPNADAFGSKVVVADLDGGKGWLDLIISAPGNEDKTSSTGRVDVFTDAGEKPDLNCYTANRCFVDNKCYEKGEASSDSKCMICDPTADNFGFVSLVCEGTATACQDAAACDDLKGCVVTNKPDGTSCAENVCVKNSLTVSVCEAGACVPSTQDCGNYACDTSLNMCPVSCKTDAECLSPYVCTAEGVCGERVNQPPVVKIFDVEDTLIGGMITIDAAVTDPEKDELTYFWACDSGVNLADEKSASVTVSLPETVKPGTTITCKLSVSDGVNVVDGEVSFKAVDVAINILTPAEKAKLENTSVTFTGTTTALSGNINITDGVKNICTAKISGGKWSCSSTLAAGDYSVRGVWDKNNTSSSDVRNFTIVEPQVENQPPVIVVENELVAKPGWLITLDASKSYDPDGDALSFKWTEPSSGLLSSLNSDKPTFSVPVDAVAGSVYAFQVTVTDARNASAVENVRVTIEVDAAEITIDSPKNDETVIGPEVTVTGSTTADAGKIVVYDANRGALCTAVVSGSEWSCAYTAEIGDYEITAEWESVAPGNKPSNTVKFSVDIPEVNHEPVVVLPEHYEIAVGDYAIIDASGSYDPDEGDTLTYIWSGSGSAFLSNGKSNKPSFTVPEDAAIGEKYGLTLTVTDNHGASSVATTEVVVTEKVVDYFVKIQNPEEGDTIEYPAYVSGIATPDTDVVVVDAATNEVLCSANTDYSDGAWGCETMLPPGGPYKIIAYNVVKERNVAEDSVTFSVSDELLRPVIVSPESGAIVSVRPTISGTVDAEKGRILVWTVDGDKSILLCSADVKADGKWECTASYDLEYSTGYAVQAYWKDGEITSQMSDTVLIVVQDPEPVKITVLTPANEAVLSSDTPVIFAGKVETEDGTPINVYTSSDGEVFTLTCSAFSNSAGYWACDDMQLGIGEYYVYADDASDDIVIPSAINHFKVEQGKYQQNAGEDVKGGSCSMTTAPASNFGWLFLLAGFAGLGLVRRRRED